jgi:hypothetical protein
LLNDIEGLIFGRTVFVGMTLAVPEGALIRAAQALAFIMMDTQVDGLVKSRITDDFVKSSKFKARALTTIRRAGGLDFRPPAEKTKARQCLQRYVCESKQSRVTRRTDRTPQ